MAKTQALKPRDAHPPALRGSGAAGAARGGGAAPVAVAAAPTILTAADFRRIGHTLNGDHWQADIAKQIGCSKSQVTRYLNESRVLNPLVARHLQYVVVERIMALAALMDLPGMPYAGTPMVSQAESEIIAALAGLPGQEPPRDR